MPMNGRRMFCKVVKFQDFKSTDWFENKKNKNKTSNEKNLSKKGSANKNKSPVVMFHGIILPYSYFEEIGILLPQFSKKQNMIKKNH